MIGFKFLCDCSEIEGRPIQLHPTGEKTHELITFTTKECKNCGVTYHIEESKRSLTPEESKALEMIENIMNNLGTYQNSLDSYRKMIHHLVTCKKVPGCLECDKIKVIHAQVMFLFEKIKTYL